MVASATLSFSVLRRACPICGSSAFSGLQETPCLFCFLSFRFLLMSLVFFFLFLFLFFCFLFCFLSFCLFVFLSFCSVSVSFPLAFFCLSNIFSVVLVFVLWSHTGRLCIVLDLSDGLGTISCRTHRSGTPFAGIVCGPRKARPHSGATLRCFHNVDALPPAALHDCCDQAGEASRQSAAPRSGETIPHQAHTALRGEGALLS